MLIPKRPAAPNTLSRWWTRRAHARNVSAPAFDATRFRRWEQLAPPQSSTPFTLMTYNILSRHYMWKQVFGYLPAQYLDWEYRFPLLNHTIQQFSCDIMCFQEMELSMYERHWKTAFPTSSYESYYIKKSLPPYWNDLPGEFIDGVGIFVNTDRFTVVDKLHINFAEYVLENKHEFQFTRDLESRLLPRNTVALILKLYDKVAQKSVYVATTHLYWSPKFNDVKLLQVKILLNILEEYVDDEPRLILLGDLNSQPDSSVFRLLNNNHVKIHDCVEFDDLDYGSNNQLISKYNEITNPYKLHNVYQSLINLDKLSFTTYTRSLTTVVDHIFVSKHFKPTKILSEVDDAYCEIEKGFPNEEFPSDHIPLVAEVEYD